MADGIQKHDSYEPASKYVIIKRNILEEPQMEETEYEHQHNCRRKVDIPRRQPKLLFDI